MGQTALHYERGLFKRPGVWVVSEHAASLAASLSIAPDCEYLKINPEKIYVLIIPSHATHNLNGSRTNTPWKETRSYLPSSPSPRSRFDSGQSYSGSHFALAVIFGYRPQVRRAIGTFILLAPKLVFHNSNLNKSTTVWAGELPKQ